MIRENQSESFIMTDREQFDSSKRGMENPQRDVAGKAGQSHGAKPAVKPGGTVGRAEPDLSKERQTEIAVEAGRRGLKDHEKDHEGKH
jgi:hypothetical protein